ncbi:TetR/AcrR family transcriptional regulator [Ruegeria arenilitoris]|uniref:TetR/AcrR family transcriptional regulator n=1 Tax=Ruegeria arenilitoris TaxID=1173585 RepID=UPI00147A9ADE|nr:TetR family transcriptional regulator C-terminal domain-containing protein [Ruegeria arenilitoris]
MTNRSYIRAPEAQRREDLIRATVDCIAEEGLKGTTVRKVAARAGVTNGLIRHHFESKEHLLLEAYRDTVRGMTRIAREAILDSNSEPRDRLCRFLKASLTAPVVDRRTFAVWANLISNIHVDDNLIDIHRESHLEFRDEIEALLRDLLEYRNPSVQECRRLAVMVNAVVDGLWLQGSMSRDLFESGELYRIALDAVSAILGFTILDTTIGESPHA